jgi:hypothetical protein
MKSVQGLDVPQTRAVSSNYCYDAKDLNLSIVGGV